MLDPYTLGSEHLVSLLPQQLQSEVVCSSLLGVFEYTSELKILGLFIFSPPFNTS
ncbi:hypothetical protein EBGED10_29400 [Bacillus sp. GeD10]|nr:hypothetical protein EBGED10_29400 [Bacillus sp. GeD10]